jgi:hypothetical protein
MQTRSEKTRLSAFSALDAAAELIVCMSNEQVHISSILNPSSRPKNVRVELEKKNPKVECTPPSNRATYPSIMVLGASLSSHYSGLEQVAAG